MKRKYDLSIENFDLYFDYLVRQMTPEQKDLLPKDILYKLFTTSGKPISNKLNFYQKWFVLFRAFKRQMFIVVEDDIHALSLQDFMVFKSKQDRREYDEEAVNALFESGTFVIGNMELVDSLSYFNMGSTKGAYNYAIKLKNSKFKTAPTLQKEYLFFANFLMQYEANKKRMIKQSGITLSDLYVLLYLFDGNERASGETYKNLFKGAMGASRKQMLDSFKKLVGLGLVNKFGNAKNTTYRITALGKQQFYETFKKFILP